MRKHIVITGTGRTGTSFLVQILTHLGMDTGFLPENVVAKMDSNARAGLEHDIRKDSSPYVVKSPWFCDVASEVLSAPDIEIEHILVPMRDLFSAASSRRRVVESYRGSTPKSPSHIAGGLWHTDHPEEQENVLLTQFYNLLLALADSNIPVSFMSFPRITQDQDYLFAKLEPVLKGVSYEKFCRVFKQVVKPEWVNTFDEPNIDATSSPSTRHCSPQGQPDESNRPDDVLPKWYIDSPKGQTLESSDELCQVELRGWALGKGPLPLYLVVRSNGLARSYAPNTDRPDVIRNVLKTEPKGHAKLLCGFCYPLQFTGELEVGFECNGEITWVKKFACKNSSDVS